nr:hypothetical protein [Tanacetum cinerariifolium]
MEKKVIISEASIRRDLRFGDKGGVDSFSNKVIFKQLTLIGDEDIFSVNDQDDTLMFDADKDLQSKEDVVEKEVASIDVSVVKEINAASITTSITTTTLTISMDEITLAKALIEINTSRPKEKGIVMQEPSETSTPTLIVSFQQPSKNFDREDVEVLWRLVKDRIIKTKPVDDMDSFLMNNLKIMFEHYFKDTVWKIQPRLTKISTTASHHGNSQMYLTFSKLLKFFDREDLEVLWRSVKDRFVKTKPVDDMDSLLMHTLKTIFEHHVEDTVWKSQQGLTKVKSWKLFDSCGVHCVTMQNILYYLLVEKTYQLKNHTLH